MSQIIPFSDRKKRVVTSFLVAIQLFNTFWFFYNSFSIWRLFNVLALPLGISAGWIYINGNATGWIVYYFGTTIHLSDGSERVKEFTEDSELDSAIAEWLRLSGIKRYERANSHCYMFLRKKDAIQFKLTWA